jgi:hypothetical protein
MLLLLLLLLFLSFFLPSTPSPFGVALLLLRAQAE